jgi:hypothetical protein
MADESGKLGLGAWLLIGGAAFAILVPTYLVLSVTIPRGLADRQIEPICKVECGIKVFEEASLNPGQAFSIGKTDWTDPEQSRPLGELYKLKKSHVFTRPYGVAVYRYTTWIERTIDRKRMSEMTWYVRQGDEIFHGKHFPDPPPKDEELIARTLQWSPPNPSLQHGPAASGRPAER